jgi:hypothetical protein
MVRNFFERMGVRIFLMMVIKVPVGGLRILRSHDFLGGMRMRGHRSSVRRGDQSERGGE